ncbi:hypothetical protein [Roseibium salinum]|uniref:Uncharacterized protein n=1 Tax=Roseibium salinum TaxID=1604349 RepID=A0ABT3QYF9_9HYPH|nr:hypothetical protein [Roseibium sp. DSM 29163]MCX2721989.1 hypothetical protein [Roseibium sp. DSM 29163]
MENPGLDEVYNCINEALPFFFGIALFWIAVLFIVIRRDYRLTFYETFLSLTGLVRLKITTKLRLLQGLALVTPFMPLGIQFYLCGQRFS